MFGKLGTGELILILILALVIFGPSKLPGVGKALGQSIREFKSHVNKVSEDVNEDVVKDNKEEDVG